MKKTLYLLSLLAFNFLSSSLMAQHIDFEIQGHRGCRGILPENTIPAFLRAIDEGVNTLELDVVISKDKQVVVSHDPFFNPDISTDPDGIYLTKETRNNLYLLNYKAIKKFDVGKRGNKGFPEQEAKKAYKPLLSEVIRKVEKYLSKEGLPPIKWNIEIKSLPKEYNISQPEVAEFSTLVHEVISSTLNPDLVTIQSFDFNVIKYWHSQINEKKFMHVSLAALIDPSGNNEIDYNLDLLQFQPDIWSPHYKKINAEMVETLHKKGMKVIPWTVNLREEMEAIKTMGCDGLITDYPNRAKKL